MQKRHASVGKHEGGSGVSADCGSAHDNPKGRSDVVGCYVKEKKPVDQQYDVYRVKRKTDAPQHMRERVDRRGRGPGCRRDRRTQNLKSFCTNDGKQPSVLYDRRVPLGFAECHDREAEIDECYPYGESEQP